MSFVENFIDAITSGLIKRHVADYIMPEIAHSEDVIDLVDGTQMTVFKVIGMQVLNGEKEFEAGIDALKRFFDTTISSPGFVFASFFERDSETTEREVDAVLKSMRNTASRLGADIDDILEDRRRVLLNKTVFEGCHFVVFTTPAVLGSDLKDRLKDRAARDASYKGAIKGKYTPNYYVHLDEIDAYHQNHIKSLSDSLTQANVAFDILDVQEACSVLGFQLERETRESTWKARVGLVPGVKGNRKEYSMAPGNRHLSDQSYVAQMPIRDALTSNDHTNIDMDGSILPDGMHRQGGMYYCTVCVKFWPDSLTSFQDLFLTIGKKLPFRSAYYVDYNRPFAFSVNNAVRSIIAGWANRRNVLAKEQVELMQDKIARNLPHVRFRGQFTTWAKSKVQLLTNIQTLQTSLSKWGSCETLVYSPNPIEAFTSSCVGATYDSPAPSHLAPTEDVAQLMPFTRPASLWARGSAQLSTKDGRLWSYNVASAEMENNSFLCAAAPRSGKSVTLNNFDFSMVFQEGMTRLPRILTVDSAPSSRGKIEMLYDRLPDHMKDQVKYYKPINSRNAEKINTLSLPLGLKYPLNEHAEFIEAFLCQISISVTEDKVPENVPEIIKDSIKKTYDRLAQIQDLTGDKAKLYRLGLFPDIDETLPSIVPVEMSSYIKEVGGKTSITWYEVRDILFKNNRISLARKAQRAASPIINDIISTLLTDQTMISKWEVDQLKRIAANMSSSVSDLPMIDGMSDVDFDNVRILSFDCGDFASASGNRGQRQSTLMYMLALFTGTQSFFYHTDSLDCFDPMYRAYSEKLISEIMEDYKRINVDEFWRTGGLPGIVSIIEMFFRVGPKFKISNLLASHNILDFPDKLISSASGFIFLGKPKENDITAIREKIGLADSAYHLLKSNNFGQKKGEMLMIFETERGRFYQHLDLNMGSTELWANSSTNRDSTFRREICKAFGQKMGYKILSKEFPSGNCEVAVDKIVKRRGSEVEINNTKVNDISPEVELAKLIIDKYEDLISAGTFG